MNITIKLESESEKRNNYQQLAILYITIKFENENRNNYQQLSCAYKSTATRPLSTHTGEAVMAPISGLRNMFW